MMGKITSMPSSSVQVFLIAVGSRLYTSGTRLSIPLVFQFSQEAVLVRGTTEQGARRKAQTAVEARAFGGLFKLTTIWRQSTVC